MITSSGLGSAELAPPELLSAPRPLCRSDVKGAADVRGADAGAPSRCTCTRAPGAYSRGDGRRARTVEGFFHVLTGWLLVVSTVVSTGGDADGAESGVADGYFDVRAGEAVAGPEGHLGHAPDAAARRVGAGGRRQPGRLHPHVHGHLPQAPVNNRRLQHGGGVRIAAFERSGAGRGAAEALRREAWRLARWLRSNG
eukprot:1181615-Prorocentrum_minimum.AAC.2